MTRKSKYKTKWKMYHLKTTKMFKLRLTKMIRTNLMITFLLLIKLIKILKKIMKTLVKIWDLLEEGKRESKAERRVLPQAPNSCRRNTWTRYTQLSNNLRWIKRMRMLTCKKKRKKSKLLPEEDVVDQHDQKKVQLNQLLVKLHPRNQLLKEVASQEVRSSRLFRAKRNNKMLKKRASTK